MAETQFRLELSSFFTVPSTGIGTITFGPVPANERWEVQRYVTYANQFGAGVILYRNYAQDSNVIDATLAGKSDAGGIQFNLQTGERCIFSYVSATPNDIITARIEGIRYVRGNRGWQR